MAIPSTASKDFGNRIRAARKAAGFDAQEDLARALDVSVYTVNRWETGRNKPSIDELWRIADKLGVSAGSLMDGREAA